MERMYICIDLKSFYASVECVERNLDPLKTNLVVADQSRTEKTICLAISPALKQYGIGGRARLFEVIEKVKEINKERQKANNYQPFTGKSIDGEILKKDKTKALDFIIAPPRMAHYIDYSTKIYNIYLKYLSAIDIFVYSIDEIFADITSYLKYYQLSAKKLVTKIIKDVYDSTGITATAGIGTNLFLAKVAMDVVAKKQNANEYGVRIAELNEKTYREEIWEHQPITDIWRVGKGIARNLEKYNIYTMGDLAECSLKNEDLLYKLFGINAELLIDHAWGYEPCTLEIIKSYRPNSKSISSSQILPLPYDYEKTKLIIKEMGDLLALDLVAKKVVTNKLVLTIGYDISNIDNKEKNAFKLTTDYYGRAIPMPAHGTINLDKETSASKIIIEAISMLYEKIVNPNLLIRRINISATNLVKVEEYDNKIKYKQFDLFSSTLKQNQKIEDDLKKEKEERKLQETLLELKEKFGKNMILKGMNLEKGGTTIMRNQQIGGHHE